MRVALINPSCASLYAKFNRPSIKRLPVGLAYVGGHLERLGHEVMAVDAEAMDYDNETTVEKALAFSPDVVGVTATTPVIHNAVDLLRRVKAARPGVFTMLGGPHPSAIPEKTLLQNRGILDVVVFGEGEHTAAEVLDTLASRGGLCAPIAGAAFFGPDGTPVVGPLRERERDLDRFTPPARHLFPMDRYLDETKFGRERYTLITTSRGCPGQCTFCGSKTTWGRLVRYASTEAVMAEMRECHDRHGVSNFVFTDDTFTLNRRHVIDVCRHIAQLPFKTRLFCSSRVNTMSEDRLEWLKKAGCYCITFGIESGNDHILKLMKKQVTSAQTRAAVKMVKDAGLEVHGSFIIGNVGDTRETIEETIRFAIDLNLDAVQFSILVPLPGTELFDLAERTGAFRAEPDQFEAFYWYYNVPANMTKLPDETLLEFQRQAYERWKASKTAA